MWGMEAYGRTDETGELAPSTMEEQAGSLLDDGNYWDSDWCVFGLCPERCVCPVGRVLSD